MRLDMKLETTVAALALLVALSPAGFAQQSQTNPPDSPVVVAETSPAIAWAQTQTPQPVSADKTAPAPDKQQEQQPPDSPNATPTQASGMQGQPDSAAQTFTGTVVKIGDKYVLRTTDNMTYQLDDQDKAKEFEGKTVKVTGGLEAKAKLIHVQNIESAS